MSLIPPKLRSGLGFARSLSKGLSRGAFFPDRSAPPAQPAPLGSACSPVGRGNQVSEFTQTVHRAAIPGLTRPLSIWHFTDLHLRAKGAHLDALCGALSTLEPADLVVLTGDVVTRGWTDEAVDQLLRALPKAHMGTFAIMGNWEHWSGVKPTDWAKRLEDQGVRLLLNEGMNIGPLHIAGTDDHLAGTAHIGRTIQAWDRDLPLLALTHSPALAPALARAGASLVLAGHSHAGQVRVPGLGALWVPMGTGQYVGGWYSVHQSWLFVGRGLGWSIAPVRWRCPPELARIELQSATEPK